MTVRNIILQIVHTFNKQKNSTSYCLIVLYKFLSDFVYCCIIAPSYSYMGLGLDFKMFQVILLSALFVFFVAPLVLMHMNGKGADTILFFLDMIYYIPGLTFITYGCSSISFVILYLLFYFALCAVNALIGHKYSVQRYFGAYYLFVILLVVAVALFKVQYNGLAIKLDLKDVYDIRQNFSQNGNRMFGYIKGSAVIIIPILVFYTLKKKNYLMSAILVFLQLGLYSTSADKIAFFLLIISVLAAFVPQISAKMFPCFFCVLLIMAFFEHLFVRDVINGVIIDKIVRRMMYEPSSISYIYYSFFQDHELLLFRQSLLKFLNLDIPYNRSIQYIIGEWNGDNSNLDNGLFGDAYANLGMYGFWIYSFLYGILFYVFNLSVKRLRNEFVIISAFSIALILVDSSFFTCLLSHGVVGILVLLMIMPRGNENDGKN